ncbi:hypothetical protein EJ04DRAFT_581498 [Polyplosphaeria fusca]|uniref:Uncharacterized protein n=1 Tax=Polyplosphaeria fusca TaxID=682080 RepID=A0A9P4UVG7_9PLEO|nr:hypothetical protein EJ04DRAFT_581498 [Polyplosphaeria fusca]
MERTLAFRTKGPVPEEKLTLNEPQMVTIPATPSGLPQNGSAVANTSPTTSPGDTQPALPSQQQVNFGSQLQSLGGTEIGARANSQVALFSSAPKARTLTPEEWNVLRQYAITTIMPKVRCERFYSSIHKASVDVNHFLDRMYTGLDWKEDVLGHVQLGHRKLCALHYLVTNLVNKGRIIIKPHGQDRSRRYIKRESRRSRDGGGTSNTEPLGRGRGWGVDMENRQCKRSRSDVYDEDVEMEDAPEACEDEHADKKRKTGREVHRL